jgi:hypothetical protein
VSACHCGLDPQSRCLVPRALHLGRDQHCLEQRSVRSRSHQVDHVPSGWSMAMLSATPETSVGVGVSVISIASNCCVVAASAASSSAECASTNKLRSVNSGASNRLRWAELPRRPALERLRVGSRTVREGTTAENFCRVYARSSRPSASLRRFHRGNCSRNSPLLALFERSQAKPLFREGSLDPSQVIFQRALPSDITRPALCPKLAHDS